MHFFLLLFNLHEKKHNMKKLSIALLTLAMAANVNAQDFITKKNGEEIKAKITEVNPSDVKYKVWDNLNGPSFTLSKSDIFLIKYENGKTEKIAANMETNDDMYAKGREDAKRYYTKHKAAGTGTLLTSMLVSPLLGLIPAIVCSSAEPKYDNLEFPTESLMKNTEYSRGYTEAAKKKKSGKVWQNFGIGSGIAVAAVLILGSGG